MSIWEQLKKQFRKPGRRDSPGAADTQPIGLTPRELDVFRLLLEGYTLQETADQLGVKYSTVNTHMTAIYKKLGVKSRAELIISYHDFKEDNEL